MDALTSLDFLIVEETKQALSMEKIASLITLLNLTSKLLPSSIGSAYGGIATWLASVNSIEEAGREWSVKVSDAIAKRSFRNTHTTDYVWKVCGVSSLPSSSSSSSSHGYTCGLWLLMHYFTITAQDKKVSAVEVMDTIKVLVSELFGCLSCRQNFMKSYDACLFERCKINKDSYELLQLWLFHVHNSVTERIHNEYEMSSSSRTTKSKGGFSIDQVLWPSKLSCPSCYTRHSAYLRSKSNNKWSDASIVQYLTKAYEVNNID